jgi:hypothetical protein
VELPQLQYPPPSTEPFPCLASPSYDILKCRRCSFCVRQVQVMQKHCAKFHNWINPRGKGRPSTGYPPADPHTWLYEYSHRFSYIHIIFNLSSKTHIHIIYSCIFI